MDVFQKQFDIAIELKRTVFIHCVGAWDKILHILKQYKKSELPIMVFHAFNGGNDIIKNLLKFYENNVFFSFGKNALYDDFWCITRIPDDKILVESDGNTDVNLRVIINKISKIKNNSNMSEVIYNNTQKVLVNG
ncbi:MAG: TatD family hydrolase [Alphaproteobacteria bacterium]|nr:TatD family hydrolase [Alphaproteobacteria bacterium]